MGCATRRGRLCDARRVLRHRSGSSLVELLIAVVLLGIIGGVASSALMQQGRVRTRIVRRLVAEAQLREAVAPVLADLGAASPGGGDVPLAQASDTGIALRIPTGEGVACDIDPADSMTVRVLILSAMRGRSIAVGDSAWRFQDGAWIAAPVQQVAGDASGGVCTSQAPGSAAVLRITLGGATAPQAGAPVRFTRRVRYSFYRAGDGGTYLGLREWSDAMGAFAGQQPVAGPLSRSGTAFRFLDSIGQPADLAQLPVGALGMVALEVTAPGVSGDETAAPPMLRTSVALRNRR